VRPFSECLVIAGLIGALAACATTPLGRKDLLSFLEPGVTTRAEVTRKLGSPHASYERGRIVAYRLSEDESGYYAPRARKSWQYSLMLVFDANAVLVKRELVKVREH